MRLRTAAALALILLTFIASACGKKQPPVARPLPPPPADTPSGSTDTPRPPEPIAERTTVPAEPTITEDPLAGSDLDKINQNSPFQPVFFALDSAEIDTAGQQALSANAGILKKYPEWVITIEGHADERGTAEYNLALGERRAKATRDYLVSVGIDAGRITVISYGEERPICADKNEACWMKHRRAHFLVKQ